MKLRKFLTVLLLAALLLSLVACTDAGETDLTGEWKGTVDISSHLSDIPGLPETPSGITFDLIFVFEEDGGFEAIIDQYSVTLMVDKLLDIVADALLETAQLKGISDQELRQMLRSTVDTDQIVASVQGSLQNGYYLYRDGVIYLSAQDDLVEDPAENAQEHLQVTVSADALTVHQIIMDSYQHEQMISGVLPLTLYKQ